MASAVGGTPIDRSSVSLDASHAATSATPVVETDKVTSVAEGKISIPDGAGSAPIQSPDDITLEVNEAEKNPLSAISVSVDPEDKTSTADVGKKALLEVSKKEQFRKSDKTIKYENWKSLLGLIPTASFEHGMEEAMHRAEGVARQCLNIASHFRT